MQQYRARLRFVAYDGTLQIIEVQKVLLESAAGRVERLKRWDDLRRHEY
jgi:hypothetical protein